MKVLIADDEVGVRAVLRRVLLPTGCHIVEADNGVAALDAISREQIAAVVIDVGMPMLNGLDVLRAMRASREHRATPVVLMSGAIDAQVAKAALTLGVVDIFAKPFDMKVLKVRLARLLDSAASGIEDAARRTVTPPRTKVEPNQGPGPVIIVDANSEFRYFAAAALSPRFEVVVVERGQEAIRVCASCRPTAVLVGADTGIFGPTLLVRKLRERVDLAETRILFVGSDEEFTALGADAPFDGAMRRVYVPEEFTVAFGAALARTFAFDDPGSLCGLVYSTILSATEQAIGMVTHTAIARAGEPVPPEPGEITASVHLRVPQDDFELRIVLRAAANDASRLGARMLGVDEASMAAEDAHSVIGELVNVIAGRVQNAVRTKGVNGKFTFPAIELVTTPVSGWQPGVTLRYQSESGDVSLHIELTARDTRSRLVA